MAQKGLKPEQLKEVAQAPELHASLAALKAAVAALEAAVADLDARVTVLEP